MEDFLQLVKDRGLLYQISDEAGFAQLSRNKQIKAYVGFDCTADGLHIGSLLPLMLVYWLHKTGNQAMVLLGGMTSMIGDPSGKDQARKLLSPETIAINKTGIENDITCLFKRHNINVSIVDNTSWLQGWSYVDFVRHIGAEVSVNRLMTMESIKNRLNNSLNLSFLEFSYPLMQAYDFLHLSRAEDRNTQIGGSDQWGNIVMGLDLIHKLGKKDCHALTTPLLVDSNNLKMGKTSNGAAWLCPKKYSNLDFWQFWRNVEDRDVVKYLLMFTTMPVSEIKALADLKGRDINRAKKLLAYEVLKFVRGEESAQNTLELAEKVYEDKKISDQLESYMVNTRTGLLVNWLAECGALPSKSEVRRLIKNHGIKLNDHIVRDAEYEITAADWHEDDYVKVSIGKKRHILFKFLLFKFL